jgi:pyruvate dehydrogenase E1 component alpha subunit
MRRMEVESDNLYKNKEIRGFCHLYIGQVIYFFIFKESIALGMEEGMTKEDCVITAYREHCNYLARGDNPKNIIAEMMSRATGSTKGKGGSMHYYSRKDNFYGGNGIVGAQIPLGTGLAFALKYLNKQNACFTLYGDGSANQGQLFEAANMAGLWKLPVVYVIENNHYGMGTSEQRSSHHRPLHSKFRSYPGIVVQGNDVFAVREAVRTCKEYAVKNGPIFLEIDTYRYQGHSMSDPGITYRTKDEVTQYRESKDCIDKVKRIILTNNVATESELKKIERDIRERIEKDVETIKSEPYPAPSELFSEIYAGENPPFIRNVEYSTSVFGEHKI